MDLGSRPPEDARRRTIEAVATFAALMHAYERGELTSANDARQALSRLGIEVRITGSHASNLGEVGGG